MNTTNINWSNSDPIEELTAEVDSFYNKSKALNKRFKIYTIIVLIGLLSLFTNLLIIYYYQKLHFLGNFTFFLSCLSSIILWQYYGIFSENDINKKQLHVLKKKVNKLFWEAHNKNEPREKLMKILSLDKKLIDSIMVSFF